MLGLFLFICLMAGIVYASYRMGHGDGRADAYKAGMKHREP